MGGSQFVSRRSVYCFCTFSVHSTDDTSLRHGSFVRNPFHFFFTSNSTTHDVCLRYKWCRGVTSKRPHSPIPLSCCARRIAFFFSGHIRRNLLLLLLLLMMIMNSNCRITVTLFPRDMVCVRNISVNTLHKGNDDDDDDDDHHHHHHHRRRRHHHLSSVLTVLEAIFRLIPSCHCSSSLFNTHIFRLILFYSTIYT